MRLTGWTSQLLSLWDLRGGGLVYIYLSIGPASPGRGGSTRMDDDL